MQRNSFIHNYLSYNNIYDEVNINSFLVFLRNKKFTEKEINNFIFQYIKDFHRDFFRTLIPFLSYMNFVRFIDEDYIKYILDNNLHDLRKTIGIFTNALLNSENINNYSKNDLLLDILAFTSEYNELGFFILLLYIHEKYENIKNFIENINSITQKGKSNLLKDKIINSAKSLKQAKLTYFKISLNKSTYDFCVMFLNTLILVANYFNFSEKYKFLRELNLNLDYQGKIKSNLGMLTYYDLHMINDYSSYKNVLNLFSKNKISMRDLLLDSIDLVMYKNFDMQSYKLNDYIQKHFINLPLTSISSFILFCSEMLDIDDVNTLFIDFSIYDKNEFLELPLYINKRLRCINNLFF